MLGLFGRKSNHPMADLKSAQELLDEVPKNDALKVILEVTVWINSVRGDDSIRLDNFFAVLNLLDETARPHEIKVLREYFTTGVRSPLIEKRQWAALNDYYSALGEAYHSVLLGCHNGEKGASALKELRPLIVARGISATTGRLKCAAVHYAPVDAAVWEQLGEFYAEAESQKCLDESIELYPDAGGSKYTVRHQFAGVLLWWASGTGSLKPMQIHLAERLTAHVCSSLTMGPEPGEDTLFSYDLTQARPPVRYGDALAHPNLRFIGHGGVQLQLDPLIKELEAGLLPDDLNLGGAYEAESVNEVAQRLSASWLAEPPSRRHARRSLDVNLAVVKGYAELVDVANMPSGGESALWVAEDVSATGFRCVLDSGQGSGVKIGSLIGFKPEKMQYWGAGIVRRLRRDEEGMVDVGVEILANRATRVKLGEDTGPAASAESFALWLGMAGAQPGESRVLVKPGSIDEGHPVHMHMGGKPYLLAPQGVQEQSDDYDLVRYRVVERDEASES